MHALKIFLSTLLSLAIWILPAQSSMDGMLTHCRAQIRSLSGYSFVVLIPSATYHAKRAGIGQIAAKQKGKVLGTLPLAKTVAVAFNAESKGYHQLAMQDSTCQVVSRDEYVRALDYAFKQRAFAWCIIGLVTTFVISKLTISLYG